MHQPYRNEAAPEQFIGAVGGQTISAACQGFSSGQKAPRRGEIPAALDAFRSVTEEIDACLSELENDLEPVMRPQSETNCRESSPSADVSSPLADALWRQVGRLRLMALRVQMLRGRIEL